MGWRNEREMGTLQAEIQSAWSHHKKASNREHSILFSKRLSPSGPFSVTVFRFFSEACCSRLYRRRLLQFSSSTKLSLHHSRYLRKSRTSAAVFFSKFSAISSNLMKGEAYFVKYVFNRISYKFNYFDEIDINAFFRKFLRSLRCKKKDVSRLRRNLLQICDKLG